MALTVVSDVVVPEIFTPYTQQITEAKSLLITSGAMGRDPQIDSMLAGGGNTFNTPSFRDLAQTADRISTGAPGQATPDPILTATEIAVRLSRNFSWGSHDLVADLAGADPMEAIAGRVGTYWAQRLQAAMIATVTGVFADNTANDAGDYTVDISGVYAPGTTDFSAEASLDALQTMGDSIGDLGLMMVHSVVYTRMRKNNLIDFIPDARGEVDIPFFQGKRVIVDDTMPVATQDYETWFFGTGALRLGVGQARVPTAIQRDESQGNGGGDESLWNRVVWAIHPVGHAYVGTSADGGPSNLATANNLAAAGSWDRRWSERKMIKIARLITTEA